MMPQEETMKERYYKQTFVFEVLGNEPLDSDCELDEIAHEIMHGGHSGTMRSVVTVEVTREEMRELLTEHGSEPDFLITEDEDERCKFCDRAIADLGKAHYHKGAYVGECCWDERLRVTE